MAILFDDTSGLNYPYINCSIRFCDQNSLAYPPYYPFWNIMSTDAPTRTSPDTSMAVTVDLPITSTALAVDLPIASTALGVDLPVVATLPLELPGLLNDVPKEHADYVELKLLPQEFRKKNMVFCEICDLEFSSQIVLDTHLSGSKHQRKAKSQTLMQSLIENESGFIKDMVSGVITCVICNVTVNSPQLLATHLAGSKHKGKKEKQKLTSGETEQEGDGATPKDKSENETAETPPKRRERKNKTRAEFDIDIPTCVTRLEMSNTKNSGGKFICNPCEALCNSVYQLSQHLTSKKHVEKEVAWQAAMYCDEYSNGRRNERRGNKRKRDSSRHYGRRFNGGRFDDGPMHDGDFGGSDRGLDYGMDRGYDRNRDYGPNCDFDGHRQSGGDFFNPNDFGGNRNCGFNSRFGDDAPYGSNLDFGPNDAYDNGSNFRPNSDFGPPNDCGPNHRFRSSEKFPLLETPHYIGPYNDHPASDDHPSPNGHPPSILGMPPNSRPSPHFDPSQNFDRPSYGPSDHPNNNGPPPTHRPPSHGGPPPYCSPPSHGGPPPYCSPPSHSAPPPYCGPPSHGGPPPYCGPPSHGGFSQNYNPPPNFDQGCGNNMENNDYNPTHNNYPPAYNNGQRNGGYSQAEKFNARNNRGKQTYDGDGNKSNDAYSDYIDKTRAFWSYYEGYCESYGKYMQGQPMTESGKTRNSSDNATVPPLHRALHAAVNTAANFVRQNEAYTYTQPLSQNFVLGRK